MSEYVCCDFDLAEGIDCRELEQIVRCRDCRWCVAYSEAAYCDRFAHALPTAVELLDGFCAWGERRDA